MTVPTTPVKSPTTDSVGNFEQNFDQQLTPSVVPSTPGPATPGPFAVTSNNLLGLPDEDDEELSRATSDRDLEDLQRRITLIHGQNKYNKTIFGHLAPDSRFQNTTLLVIVINAIWICIDVEWNHANLENQAGRLPLQPFSDIVEQAFCFFFSAELLVRFMAFERKEYMFRDAWFMFDGTLVAFMVLETWILPFVALVTQADSGNGGTMSSLSSFRLLRLLRLTRMARIMAFFPELMILVKGLFRALKTVVWIVLFLVLLTYVFAIVFTSQVAEPGMCPEWPSEDDPGVAQNASATRRLTGEDSDAYPTDGQRMFCTLFSSIMTLFTMGVLGDDLHPALMAIKDTSVPDNKDYSLVLMWIFVAFLLFSFITLLNMLIGVLCQVITETSDQEEEENSRLKLEQALINAFRKADKSEDARISQDEWTEMANNPEVVETLVQLGVDQGTMKEKLMQMQETLFGARGKAIVNRPRTTMGCQKFTIGFAEFEDKVKELTWKRPASAIEIKMLESYSRDRTAAIKHRLMKVETSLLRYREQRRRRGPRQGRPASPPSPTGGTGGSADAMYPKSLAAKPPPNLNNAWMQDVPSNMLMHILKTRAVHEALDPSDMKAG